MNQTLVDITNAPCAECAEMGKRGPNGEHLCDSCGEEIPEYIHMGGSGFQGPRPVHLHFESTADGPRQSASFKELCLKCYRDAFAEAHPEEPLPAAPGRIVYD